MKKLLYSYLIVATLAIASGAQAADSEKMQANALRKLQIAEELLKRQPHLHYTVANFCNVAWTCGTPLAIVSMYKDLYPKGKMPDEVELAIKQSLETANLCVDTAKVSAITMLNGAVNHINTIKDHAQLSLPGAPNKIANLTYSLTNIGEATEFGLTYTLYTIFHLWPDPHNRPTEIKSLIEKLNSTVQKATETTAIMSKELLSILDPEAAKAATITLSDSKSAQPAVPTVLKQMVGSEKKSKSMAEQKKERDLDEEGLKKIGIKGSPQQIADFIKQQEEALQQFKNLALNPNNSKS
jgi:hypothetical protein